MLSLCAISTSCIFWRALMLCCNTGAGGNSTLFESNPTTSECQTPHQAQHQSEAENATSPGESLRDSTSATDTSHHVVSQKTSSLNPAPLVAHGAEATNIVTGSSELKSDTHAKSGGSSNSRRVHTNYWSSERKTSRKLHIDTSLKSGTTVHEKKKTTVTTSWTSHIFSFTRRSRTKKELRDSENAQKEPLSRDRSSSDISINEHLASQDLYVLTTHRFLHLIGFAISGSFSLMDLERSRVSLEVFEVRSAFWSLQELLFVATGHLTLPGYILWAPLLKYVPKWSPVLVTIWGSFQTQPVTNIGP